MLYGSDDLVHRGTRVMHTKWLGRMRALLKLSSLAGAAVLFVACGKPDNPDDYPVSHWLKDGEDCTRASAKAIMDSGLPYPNFAVEDLRPTTGEPVARMKTVDMWLGPTRFVVPAEVAGTNGFYPRTHPRRHQRLSGSLPQFYPRGPIGPEVDGMGSMVDVTFQCSMDAKYMAAYGKGAKSNAEAIEKIKARYEADAAQFDPKRSGPSRITINRREDIGMVEVLYERGGGIYNDGQPMWEATYWPINGEMRSPAGTVSGIACQTRNDPQHRYGKRGWTCGSGVALTPHAAAVIEIYVSQVQHMPAVFEQVKRVLIEAQQPTRK